MSTESKSQGPLIIALIIATILVMFALVNGRQDETPVPTPSGSPVSRMMLQPGVQGTLYEVISSRGSELVCAGAEDDLPESLKIIVVGACNN